MGVKRQLIDRLLCAHGWLALQSEAFQNEVLRFSHLIPFEPGEVVYRLGDPLGGIYGLVSGVVTIDTAPLGEAPRLVSIGTPGSWTGEGCFLSRQPRRLTLQARSHVWLVHLPLAAMDEIAVNDPEAVLRFAQILMATVENLMQIVHDLQISHVEQRIASVIGRIALASPDAIPLTQAELGGMANASRIQVNAVLHRFAERGWVKCSYRAIAVLDARAMLRFAQAGVRHD